MSFEDYYRPDTPRVIYEIIDGEAVMIHMEKGYYYSLDRAGSTIWNLLDQGTAVSKITPLLQQHYTAEPAQIEEGVRNLLLQLQTEELIVPGRRAQAGTEKDEQTSTHMNGSAAGQNKIPFIAPELHKYTDMEDLLLLDPIHEVDETGWPALPDEG
jgi:hypothetical protein